MTYEKKEERIDKIPANDPLIKERKVQAMKMINDSDNFVVIANTIEKPDQFASLSAVSPPSLLTIVMVMKKTMNEIFESLKKAITED